LVYPFIATIPLIAGTDPVYITVCGTTSNGGNIIDHGILATEATIEQSLKAIVTIPVVVPIQIIPSHLITTAIPKTTFGLVRLKFYLPGKERNRNEVISKWGKLHLY
jgi:hypothetical protein